MCDTLRKCTKCEKEKPFLEYGQYKDNRGNVRYAASCKECKRAADRVYAKTDAGKQRGKRGCANYRQTDKYVYAVDRSKTKYKEKMLVLRQGDTCPILCRRCAGCGKSKVYKGSELGKYKHATDRMGCCRAGMKRTVIDSVCPDCNVVHQSSIIASRCDKCSNVARNRSRSEYANHMERARKHGVVSEKVIRSIVYERDGYRCYACGCDVVESKVYRPDRATLDHVIPMAKGGANTYDNVRTMCVSCNTKKWNYPPEYIVPMLRDGTWKPSSKRREVAPPDAGQ